MTCKKKKERETIQKFMHQKTMCLNVQNNILETNHYASQPIVLKILIKHTYNKVL